MHNQQGNSFRGEKIVSWCLQKYRAYISAFLFGSLVAFSFAPYFSKVTLFSGLILFILLLLQKNIRPFWLGLAFGAGYFLWSLTWVLKSIHQYGGVPLILAWGVLIGFACLLALYMGLFAWGVVRLMVARKTFVQTLFFAFTVALLWTLLESLRARLLTGFPWNLLGYAWADHVVWIQVADLGGVYLLSFLTLFISALSAVLLNHWMIHYRIKRAVGAMLVVLFLGWYGYGVWSLSGDDKVQEQRRFALVQGNIPQEEKWNPSYRRRNISRYIKLSQQLNEEVDLFIWPETASPYILSYEPELQRLLERITKEKRAAILLGTPEVQGRRSQRKLFNSVFFFDQITKQWQAYHKRHLVPFGEYIPLRFLMPSFIDKVTVGDRDYSSGLEANIITWGASKERIGSLICYEVIFSHEVRATVEEGVDWLINITNDAWFGETIKTQHLAMARLRAVEMRRPLVRVANTGISAGFDASGREVGRIDSNQKSVQVITLLKHKNIVSLYLWWGEGWLLLLLVLWGIGRRQFSKTKP
ncbi:apolipoprotein N-acyltransferase [Magnetococcales bacterium HHB-1]